MTIRAARPCTPTRAQAITLACLLGAVLVIAGCGGGSSSAGDEKDGKPRLEGVYSGTRTTGETTFVGNIEGSTLPLSYVHICEDKACDVVWQRALDQPTGAGVTVRLHRTDDDTWEATHTRKSGCFEDSTKAGKFTSSFTWKLSGKQLGSTAQYELNGCSKPYAEESTTKLKADPKAKASFLEPDDSGPLKEAITAFDAGYSTFTKREPKCSKQAATAGQVPQGIDCYKGAFKPWKAGVARMPAALKDVAKGATGDCKGALEAVTPLVQGEIRNLDGVAKMYDNDPASRWSAVNAAEQKLSQQAHRTHVAVADVAYFCVSPIDVEGLGSNGTLLVLDENLSLAPMGADDDAEPARAEK